MKTLKIFITLVISLAYFHNIYAQLPANYYIPGNIYLIGRTFNVGFLKPGINPVTKETYEYTEEQKKQLLTNDKLFWGDKIIYLGEATGSYNCHAYAWYLSSYGLKKGNLFWLNSPEEQKFYADPTFSSENQIYKKVETEDKWEATVVSYLPEDHTAITTGEPGYFVSKWNVGPLYYHRFDNCPYYSGQILTYYTNCTPTKNYTKTYNSGTTIPTITGCNIEIKNVEIYNTTTIQYVSDRKVRINSLLAYDKSNVEISAPQGIEITGPFEIKLGSTLILESGGYDYTVKLEETK